MNLSKLNNESGSSLILVLLLTTVLLILGLALARTTLFQYQSTITQERKIQAYYIAKSGANIVASAIQNKLVDPAALDGKISSPERLNNGSFVVSVTDNGAIVTITSTGTIQGVQHETILELTRVVGTGNIPLLDHAVFADKLIDMNNSIVRGRLGVNENGNNGTAVKLTGNPAIDGNIFIGPDGIAKQAVQAPGIWWWEDWSAEHDGDGEVHNLPEEREYILPEYPAFPDGLTQRGSYTAGWWPEPPYQIYSSGQYDVLKVESELILNIYDEDMVIRANELIVNESGKITVNRHGDGKLKLYVDNDFQLNGSGAVNKEGNPKDVFMYYSGENTNIDGDTKFVGSTFIKKADLEIEGSGGITGNIITAGSNVLINGNASAHVRALYAPNADVRFTGSGHATGAVIGKNIYMEGGSHVTYDESMKDIGAEQLGFEVSEDFKRMWK